MLPTDKYKIEELRSAAHQHNRKIFSSQNDFAKELSARGHSKIVYKLRVNAYRRTAQKYNGDLRILRRYYEKTIRARDFKFYL